MICRSPLVISQFLLNNKKRWWAIHRCSPLQQTSHNSSPSLEIPQDIDVAIILQLLPLDAHLLEVLPNKPHPWPMVSLDNLTRDLDEGLDDLFSQDLESPTYSCVSFIGDDQDVEILSESNESTQYCTCDHDDHDVALGLESDSDILSYYYGHYKDLSQTCVYAV